MDLLEFSIYLSNCAIYFTIAIYLLAVKVRVKGGDDFMHVRLLMAVGTMLLLLKGVTCLSFILRGLDYFLLDKFLVPINFYFFFYIVTFALLKLMHSKIVLGHKLRMFPIPVIALLVVYCISYLVCVGPHLTVAGYEAFIKMAMPRLCSVVLAVIIIAEVAIGAIELIRTSRYYRQEVSNYFSGAQELLGSRVSRVVWLFIVYVVLSVNDFLISARTVDLTVMVINTSVFMMLALVILNMHNTFAVMTPAFSGESVTTDDDETKVNADDIHEDAPEEVSQETEHEDNADKTAGSEAEDAAAAEARRYIEEIVHLWSSRPDKPFLRDGLTIAETAGQMGISSRLLSRYLNDIFEMNFNSWINMLRVNEVKELIREGSSLTMTELAEMSGFTDSSAMSKVFKRQEGVTPTQYRNNVRVPSDSDQTVK